MPGPSSASEAACHQKEGNPMFIGVGTIVIIVLIILLLRRR